MNKIKIANSLFPRGLANILNSSSMKLHDTEDTIARSSSSASKINEIKSTYRKRKNLAEGSGPWEPTSRNTASVQQNAYFDSKRSFSSNYSKGGFIDRTASVIKIDSTSEPLLSKIKIIKQGLHFGPDYKPTLITTNQCKLF